MSGPLDGFRILDLSAVVAGPLTGALLADQGADVIKVERVGPGDIQRHVGSLRGGMSGNFHVLNRGKRSLALDLKTEQGQEILRRLVETADGLIQNYRPDVMARVGLHYEALARINPGLVYLSISGFGARGPDAGRRAYDPIIQARSGLAWVQGLRRGDGPEQVNQLLVDKITAYTAAQALVAALLARSRSGRGQHVEVSMLHAAIAFLWPDAGADQILQGNGIDHRPPIGAAGHLARYADGWGTTMTLSDHEFEGLCAVYQLPELLADERFRKIENRQRHRTELRETLDRVAAEPAARMTLEEAERRFEAAEVPFGRVRSLEELPGDPQVEAADIFRCIEHPIAGELREARPAPRFSATPSERTGLAPDVGEHSREILRQSGLSDDEIESLVDGGVVGVP